MCVCVCVCVCVCSRVLRKIFGPKMEEVTGNWGRLHREELYFM